MSRKFNKTTNVAVVLVSAALTLSVSAASAGNVGVDVNINLGGQPRRSMYPHRSFRLCRSSASNRM